MNGANWEVSRWETELSDVVNLLGFSLPLLFPLHFSPSLSPPPSFSSPPGHRPAASVSIWPCPQHKRNSHTHIRVFLLPPPCQTHTHDGNTWTLAIRRRSTKASQTQTEPLTNVRMGYDAFMDSKTMWAYQEFIFFSYNLCWQTLSLRCYPNNTSTFGLTVGVGLGWSNLLIDQWKTGGSFMNDLEITHVNLCYLFRSSFTPVQSDQIESPPWDFFCWGGG